jgi:hypothetical protein
VLDARLNGGRSVASLFALLIAYHLGDLKAGVEQPAAAYARALNYGEPRYLLEGIIRDPDVHIRRDAEARVRLLATVDIDLGSADFEAIIGGLRRLLAALPEPLRIIFTEVASLPE